MYLFFTLLFMFLVLIVNWKYASASHQVPTNHQYIHLLKHKKIHPLLLNSPKGKLHYVLRSFNVSLSVPEYRIAGMFGMVNVWRVTELKKLAK